MNFLNVIVNGYIIVAGLCVFFIIRDLLKTEPLDKPRKITRKKYSSEERQTSRLEIFWKKLKKPYLPFTENLRTWGIILAAILFIGIVLAIDARYIEYRLLTVRQITLKETVLTKPLKIVWITDLQVGVYKKSAWVEKIMARVDRINPDLVLFGGDLIDNEATFEDETIYLKPLYRLAKKYPAYYILGNHEYGIGSKTKYFPQYRTGDRSQDLIDRMKELNIPLLRNSLACPEIKGEKICLYGLDDIWSKPPSFKELKNWDQTTPLIFLTHNPDGIMYWPENYKKPILALAGHTHGGQIWLPIWGPVGNAEIDLGKKYYSGLNYYENIPIFTSVGAGESGAPLRLFNPPEIAVINLEPQKTGP